MMRSSRGLTSAWNATPVPLRSTGEVQAERVAELESRVAELESQQGRVLELEERLDFAERLLAQERGPARIPGERASP